MNAECRWPSPIVLGAWFGLRPHLAEALAGAKLSFAWNRPGWHPASKGTRRYGNQRIPAALADAWVQHDRSGDPHAAMPAARLYAGSQP